MSVLGVIVNFVLVVIGSAIVILFPLYASTRAIVSASSRDHQQWLTYWILYSFLTLFELYCSSIISWYAMIQVWPWVKLGICMWLALPRFNGAAYLYEKFALKIESKERAMDGHSKEIKEREKEDEEDRDDDDEDEEKKIFNAWKLVEDYIDRNGADSLETIIKAALEAEQAEMKKTKET